MRKINSVLSISIIVLFLFHIITGSFELFGIITGGGALMHTVTGIMLVAVGAHILIGIKLTADTVKAQRKAGVSYFRENKLFWTRRISGFALILFMTEHIMVFMGHTENGEYRLNPFYAPQLICSILFVLTLLMHIVTNIRPLMISLGAQSFAKLITDAGVILSVILLVAGAAFVVYFIRWGF